MRLGVRYWLAAAIVLPLQVGLAQGGERPSAALLSNTCAGCHGTYGFASDAAPPIHGLPEGVFIQAMQDFKSGKRKATIMDRIAKGYQDEDFAAMAKFFTALKPPMNQAADVPQPTGAH